MTKTCNRTKTHKNYKETPARHYQLISDEKRKQLVDLVTRDQMRIIDAAKLTNISYENAKAIVRVYKKSGRITKKTTYAKRGAQKNQSEDHEEMEARESKDSA